MSHNFVDVGIDFGDAERARGLIFGLGIMAFSVSWLYERWA